QVQARLDRALRQLEAQTTVVARPAARLAAGQRPRGRLPKTDLVAHAQAVTAARQVTEATRYLTQEWRRLLDVVVVDRRGVVTVAQRQDDLEAMLRLLAEVAEMAPAPQQDDLHRLHTHLTDALPHLLTFVPQV